MNSLNPKPRDRDRSARNISLVCYNTLIVATSHKPCILIPVQFLRRHICPLVLQLYQQLKDNGSFSETYNRRLERWWKHSLQGYQSGLWFMSHWDLVGVFSLHTLNFVLGMFRM